MLQDEIGLAGARVRAGVAAFDPSGPGFEKTASGTGRQASRPAKPLEPVLDALPMGDERGGFLVLGILRDVAGLIARLDRAFAGGMAGRLQDGRLGAARSFRVPISAG